jgi:hypothetical protein
LGGERSGVGREKPMGEGHIFISFFMVNKKIELPILGRPPLCAKGWENKCSKVSHTH